MLAGLLPGHSGDLSTLFEPFHSVVRVVYRSGAFGFHHIIDACVIYSSAPFIFVPSFFVGLCYPFGPRLRASRVLGAVLTYHW